MSSKVMASFSAFQLGRICPMVQCLPKLSPCVSPVLICSSGDLVVHLLQGGRGGISGSEVVSCSHPFQFFSAGTGSILIRCRPEGICRDADFRMIAISFLHFGSLMEAVLCSVYPISPYDIGPTLLSLS